mgnify:CR=1 FL=1
MNILIFCIILKYSTEQLMSPFYGDIDLKTYLHAIKHSKRNILIVINDLHTDNNRTIIYNQQSSSNSSMTKYLHSEGIPHRLFSSLTPTQLKSQLPVFSFSSKPNVIMLFDFPASNLNQSNMSLLLESLQKIHLDCRHCLPLIAIVDLPVSIIVELVDRFKLLRNNFQAVILSKKSNLVVHVNPVLFGCLQERRIFVPRKKDDFPKLKTSFRECNLHNATLNVSISHVSKSL